LGQAPPDVDRTASEVWAQLVALSRPHIEQGHISSSSCILANLSMQLGRPLQWDAAKGQIMGA
jgi:hypothetical protein